MGVLVSDLQERLRSARSGGPEVARRRHLDRGKLLPRERVERLLDPGSPFLELSPLAAHGMYGGEAPGAGIITGIGASPGGGAWSCANDATVKGGTYYPMTVKKHLRAQEVALRTGCRASTSSTPAGRSCPEQDEVFPDRDHFGRIFYNQATMSAAGHPAGRRRARVVHRGRRLRAGDERRDRHRAQPGHDLPRRPAAGEGRHRGGGHRRGARRRRPARPISGGHRPPRRRRRARAADRPPDHCHPAARGPPPWPMADPESRGHDPAELHGVVPVDEREPYDVREVIARLVDGSRFHEFKARATATTLVTGFAHIWGHPSASWPTTGSCSPSRRSRARTSSSCATSADPAGVPAEHHRVHGGSGLRGRRHRQARRQDGHRRGLCPGAEAHRGHRRLLRRRQLQHVRPGVLAPVPVDVAQRPHLGHGRRAGCVGARHRAARPARGPGRDWSPRTRRRSGADPGPVRGAGPPVLRHRPAVGRRRHRARSDTRMVLGLALGRRPQAPHSAPPATASSGCEPVFSSVSSPTAARSPCGSSAPCTGSASASSPCTATPTGARHVLRGRRGRSARPGVRPSTATSHVDRIVDAASATGAEALHPGYGFLSENAGASPGLRRRRPHLRRPAGRPSAMGDKIEAKRRTVAAGVAVVPGCDERRAHRRRPGCGRRGIGFPVLVKPSAGGGGKGMRLVRSRRAADAIAIGPPGGRRRVRRRHAAARAVRRAAPPRRGPGPRSTSTATWCTSASASAACSAATRRSSRRHPRRCSTPELRAAIGEQALGWRGRAATRTPAPSSSSCRPTGPTSRTSWR
jgi:hypothetical protein